jgi:hypothetical protein
MPVAIFEIVFIGTVLIILASTTSYYIVTRTKAKWKNNHVQINKLDMFEARIAAIETRLTDIQDIVISIDEQLKRQPYDRLNSPKTPTRDFA